MFGQTELVNEIDIILINVTNRFLWFWYIIAVTPIGLCFKMVFWNKLMIMDSASIIEKQYYKSNVY